MGTYKQFIEDNTEQLAREKAMHDRELELEKRATGLMEKERDLALDQARHYQNLYEGVKSKKAGVGCWMKRIFSFGIARCP